MQTKHSKRFTELKSKIDRTKTYPIDEAVKMMKETAKTKFDSTVEIHIKTGIDTSKSDQQMRSTISLPHGSGKKIKIAVLVADDKVKDLKGCGADLIGGSELIDKVLKEQKIDADVVLTTPDYMPQVAKLAKILGPKGLMPNPKTETVTPNIKKAVEELTKGKITYKTDDTGNIHLIIGKASFDDNKLIENFKVVMEAINKAKPNAVKGIFLKNITLTSSMGPGIKVQI